MTGGEFLLNPKHWRDHFDETLAKAELARKPEVRDRLLKVAQEYQRLADRAELWRSLQSLETSAAESVS
jgi:hypothetical protein